MKISIVSSDVMSDILLLSLGTVSFFFVFFFFFFFFFFFYFAFDWLLHRPSWRCPTPSFPVEFLFLFFFFLSTATTTTLSPLISSNLPSVSFSISKQQQGRKTRRGEIWKKKRFFFTRSAVSISCAPEPDAFRASRTTSNTTKIVVVLLEFVSNLVFFLSIETFSSAAETEKIFLLTRVEYRPIAFEMSHLDVRIGTKTLFLDRLFR